MITRSVSEAIAIELDTIHNEMTEFDLSIEDLKSESIKTQGNSLENTVAIKSVCRRFENRLQRIEYAIGKIQSKLG